MGSEVKMTSAGLRAAFLVFTLRTPVVTAFEKLRALRAQA
jgi:hypothetical protein